MSQKKSNWMLWFFLILAMLTATAGVVLGALCMVKKADKSDSVVTPLREFEASAITVPLNDTVGLPNTIRIDFTEKHQPNPYFTHEVRSNLDGLRRNSWVRDLTETQAVLQVLPAPGDSDVYMDISDMVSTSRNEHRFHRNTVPLTTYSYKVASDALVNAGQVVNGMSCLYYTNYNYGAANDGQSSLQYSWYNPLSNHWGTPQNVVQFVDNGDAGNAHDFALTTLNNHPALAYVDPQASSGTTTINFRYLKDAEKSAAADCLASSFTSDYGLLNANGNFHKSSLAMVEFGTSAVIGYIWNNSGALQVNLRVAPVGDVTTPTYTWGTAIKVVDTAGYASLTAASTQRLSLLPFTHPDGTKRLIVSFLVADTTYNTAVMYMSSSADLSSATWTQVVVAANVVENTLFSNFVITSPSAGKLCATWMNATTGLVSYAFSVNTAGVFTFPTVKTLPYKCNGTFTANVMGAGEVAVLYGVANDETTVRYRNLPMYALITGETTTPTSSTLYMHDGFGNVGSCLGLALYENAPSLLLGDSNGLLRNIQGVFNNHAMTPGLVINYSVY